MSDEQKDKLEAIYLNLYDQGLRQSIDLIHVLVHQEHERVVIEHRCKEKEMRVARELWSKDRKDQSAAATMLMATEEIDTLRKKVQQLRDAEQFSLILVNTMRKDWQ
jgi:hypothetical protein